MERARRPNASELAAYLEVVRELADDQPDIHQHLGPVPKGCKICRDGSGRVRRAYPR